MPLPHFDSQGELPAGVHQAAMDEIIARFGSGTSQRQAVTTRLLRIYHLIHATGKLERLIIFRSYITTKLNPNDVDLVLVLADDFNLQACDEGTRLLFEHTRATEEFGASIFWIALRCWSWNLSMSASPTSKSSVTGLAVALWRCEHDSQ